VVLQVFLGVLRTRIVSLLVRQIGSLQVHTRYQTFSLKKTEVLCLSRRPRQCILQVTRNTLQQVETFKYLEVVFTGDGSRNKGSDARTGKANAFLRELYCSVVTKRELSKTSKAFSFNIGLCSDPHLLLWVLSDDWKNNVKKTNGRDGIFAKRCWCDTSWQRAQVWNQ